MQPKHVKTIFNLLLYLTGILLICLLLPKFLRFFMPFVIGWVIALLANPLVRFFEKRFKIVRKHGTWLVIVGALVLVIGVCYLLLTWLVREGIGFVQHIPQMYTAMMDGFREIGKNVSVFLNRLNLPVSMKAEAADFFANIDTYLADLIGELGMPTLSAAGDLVSHLPNLFVQAVFMFLAAYFFIADKEKISAYWVRVMPEAVMERWLWIKKMFSKAVGGYFLAQLKIMGVIAGILFVGFLFLDVEYGALWAILIALLDFLPFFGTGTAIWPWAAFQLATGNYFMAAVLMIIYLVCLLVHQLLQPKFVGDTVGMAPLETLVVLFIGYRLGGVPGMILALPMGIIVLSLYKAGAFDQMIRDVRSLVRDLNEYRKN